MMLPNSGTQKFHRTVSGFPVVKSLFMVCLLFSLYIFQFSIILSTVQFEKYMFDIIAISILYGR